MAEAMKKVTKLFNLALKSIDEVNKSVRFVISTDEVDRYGESVHQKSWNFKEYLKNPIVLWGHDPDEPENVLGTASDLEVDKDGSKTYATLTFDTEINPRADLIFRQIVKRTLRTVSVGFRNHTFEIENDTPVLRDNDLLEISVVPIPANPGAIALDYKAGGMTKKDATWLMDSMRKELDALDVQMKQDNNSEGDAKDMEEVKTQLAAAIDLITKLSATVDEVKGTVSDLTTTVAELKTKADEQPPKSDEGKEGEGDQPPAKSGDGDQDGAGGDEFDENAELTPEAQAAIDAAFAEPDEGAAGDE